MGREEEKGGGMDRCWEEEEWVDDLQGRQKGEESGEVRTIGVLVESGVTE